MIYKLIKRWIQKVISELDIDIQFDNNILYIIIKIDQKIVFKKTINLKIPNQ